MADPEDDGLGSEFEGLRISWLDAFVRVARAGKRTAAAEELGITQSAVTKHIKKLERWIGKVLIVENAQPVVLHPDGRDFLPVAEEILRLLRAARKPHARGRTGNPTV